MKTLIELFETSVRSFGDNPLLWEKTNGQYAPLSYKETRRCVHEFGAGLMTLGLNKGDRVGLLSEGRSHWLLGELGILYCGAINVPLSIKLEISELKFRMEHSGARVLVVSSWQAAKIAPIIGHLPALEHVVLLDPMENPGPRAVTFEAVRARGEAFLASEANRARFARVWQSVQPDDLANISYTSGTTADPKGVMLTQRNYAINVRQSHSVLDIHAHYKTLAILPWDHSFAHTACLYTFMMKGASVGAIQMGRTPMETLRNIPANIREFKPDILMSVPALSKNFRKSIEKNIQSKGAFAETLFNCGLKLAYWHDGDGWNRGKGWRTLLKPGRLFFDKILFSKIRSGFGGNLMFFIGGGAFLDMELQRFFSAIGIPIYQGYGLTEAAPVISANAPHAVRFGSSGKVVAFLEAKICDEQGRSLPRGEKGEIRVKGENVMKGYWNNPKATQETLVDGWLRTGDMGYMSQDGYLYVLGRFKSLLIGNDGEKFSPEGIEETLVDRSPFLDQAMLHNNQDPCTLGLVVPNMAAINRCLEKEGMDPRSDEGCRRSLEIIQAEIDQYRKGGRYQGLFPERWLPAAVAVLPEAFTEQNHLLNSTMKMVRSKIIEHFAQEMAFLQTGEGKNMLNKQNLEAIRRWNIG